MAEEPGYRALCARTFVALLASLVFIGTPALLFWLADQQILPWRDEASWLEARQRLIEPLDQLSPLAADILAKASIELERRCYEDCPDYRVTIWGSGRVVFEGLRHTCAPGIHTAQIDPRIATDLIADLHVSRFYELWWVPDPAIADASTAIIRFSLHVPPVVHEHHLGDRNAPRVLFDMERTIDEVTGSARWLPQRVDRAWTCLADDGTRRPYVRAP